LHATALAPTTNLADALALISLRRAMPRGFEYGWVRVAGSAAFIVAFCRMAIASQGLSVVIWMQALLMLTVEYHQYADCRAAASRSAQLALLSDLGPDRIVQQYAAFSAKPAVQPDLPHLLMPAHRSSTVIAS
jgi:hypothetical protein